MHDHVVRRRNDLERLRLEAARDNAYFASGTLKIDPKNNPWREKRAAPKIRIGARELGLAMGLKPKPKEARPDGGK